MKVGTGAGRPTFRKWAELLLSSALAAWAVVTGTQAISFLQSQLPSSVLISCVAGLSMLAAWELRAEWAAASQRRQAAFDVIRQEYGAAVEQSPVMIYAHDPSGRLLGVNGAAEAVLGLERGQLIGRTLIELVAPYHQKQAAIWISDLANGAITGHKQWDFRVPGGRTVTLEMRAHPVEREDKVISVQGVARPIPSRFTG